MLKEYFEILLLPPTNKVCEGYVFTRVCLSTGGGMCAWQGGGHACMAGGMHDRKGVHGSGGHVWQGAWNACPQQIP